MAFIRKKTIFDKEKKYSSEYAYLVTNRWTSKGSRQKAQYLGKVERFEITDDISFYDHLLKTRGFTPDVFINSNNKDIVLNELIEWELTRRGFSRSELILDSGKETVLNYSKYLYKNLKVMKISTGKEAILEMNEGFLCNHSILHLLRLKPTGYDEREQGVKLAKAILEAGLKVEHDLFIVLFEKWTKTS